MMAKMDTVLYEVLLYIIISFNPQIKDREELLLPSTKC